MNLHTSEVFPPNPPIYELLKYKKIKKFLAIFREAQFDSYK